MAGTDTTGTAIRSPARHAADRTPVSSPAADHASDPCPLGASLEPVLKTACHDRLSDVSWFRTDWQRGGALTGYANYCDEHGENHRVVVKLPVPPAERHWLVHLQPHDHLVPRLFHHGDTLGGYDFAWVVMEALPHGPLGAAWQGKEFDMLIDAAARFYAATSTLPPVGKPDMRDWPDLVDRARKRLQSANIPHVQRWRKAMKKNKAKLKQAHAVWNDRPLADCCHGDLHLANAMTRLPAPQGPAVLLDFARVRPGHWTEDAVYFEHLYWHAENHPGLHKLAKRLADQRKIRDLTVDAHWPRYAQAKRMLLAMTAPLRLHQTAHPKHLEMALAIIETTNL